MTNQLPSHAQAVIIGGGVIGCSVAYHLTKLGWRDVVLLERRQLTCGTTWHAAGLIGQLRGSHTMTKLARYSAGLYTRLGEETGQPTGFKQNGSLYLARDHERFEEYRRNASMAKSFDLEAHVIDVAEAKRLWPLLNPEGLVGGLFVPSDGQANPVDVALALAKGARTGGARVVEGVRVTGITRRNGRAVGVETDRGPVAAEVVVNCAGMWAREVGRWAGVNVPLHACEHFYVLTEPFEGVTPGLPVMRDQAGYIYVKEDAGRLLVGCFEPAAKPWGMDGIPDDFAFGELPEDWEHFEPVMVEAIRRIPALERVGIRKFFCGPESFTPDNRYLLGEAPELPGFFVAAGFNSIGIQSAGGAGRALAEWIAAGHPTMDLWEVDIRRMMPFQGNARYLRERVTETLGLLYADHWPYRQPATSRGARTSPLHARLAARNACFGEVAGWERPNWYAPEGVTPEYRYSWKRQNWFDHAAAEHRAVREAVGLFDLSSFAKFLLQGPDAESVLQRVCANDVAVPPGKIVYTQWLNERGGIEADLTVTRLAEDAFLVVTAAASQVRDLTWLKRHIGDARATVADVTPAHAVLGLMGPRSREVLARATPADLSDAAFPYATAREIELGYALARAHRISYAGELGYELYVPAEFAAHAFDALFGAAPDIKLAGFHALNSLRLEKGYRHWGHDITDHDTPIEAGLAFACALDKDAPFIGRDALLRQREAGVARRLVQFALEDPEPLLYHNEPIWRDGMLVGRLTSGAYGHTLGRAIGMGYVEHPDADAAFVVSGRFELEIAGERYPAAAGLRAWHDPAGERLRG
ncbi:MAG TPA: FAD-dependent oxidoreductase [Geminicoccaceae bacterium]|nr:FAD-dependent oxidoreductase [Geminicoccaceae bacterium]